MDKIFVIPDIHCRSFYKPVLDIKETPIVFLGDYLDPYYWDHTNDKDGIENLKEIFDLARNNKNVTLLCGNHDEEWIWSPMGFSRTNLRHYDELHKLYRDNVDLLHPVLKVDNTIFTHAGISAGWLECIKEEDIVSYIEKEWKSELQYDRAVTNLWSELRSNIFWIGRSRGGDAYYGGPFWNDYWSDFHPTKKFPYNQIFGHTQAENTGITQELSPDPSSTKTIS